MFLFQHLKNCIIVIKQSWNMNLIVPCKYLDMDGVAAIFVYYADVHNQLGIKIKNWKWHKNIKRYVFIATI